MVRQPPNWKRPLELFEAIRVCGLGQCKNHMTRPIAQYIVNEAANAVATFKARLEKNKGDWPLFLRVLSICDTGCASGARCPRCRILKSCLAGSEGSMRGVWNININTLFMRVKFTNTSERQLGVLLRAIRKSIKAAHEKERKMNTQWMKDVKRRSKMGHYDWWVARRTTTVTVETRVI